MRKWMIYSPNLEKFYFIFNTSVIWVGESVMCSAWGDFDSLIKHVEYVYYSKDYGLDRFFLKDCIAIPVDNCTKETWLIPNVEIDWRCGIPLTEVSTIGQI